MKEQIVVTGGSGMVGRALQEIMPNAIYLSSKEYDLRYRDDVIKMLHTLKPTIIIHLAAKIGGILDNINKPAEYFTDNLLMNTILMEESYKFGITRFITMLTSCIYPDIVETYPMNEELIHDGGPTQSHFSYAYSKRCSAIQCDTYNHQYGTNYQYLIPSNLYGEYGEDKHFIDILMQKIIIAKNQKSDKITLFGTGKPQRQFLHISDLAYVIKECIDKNIYTNMNVSTKDSYSIQEMAEIALKVCDAEHLKIEYDETKPDGQFRKDISIERLLTEIPNFKPISLEDGIRNTYNSIKNKYE